MSETLQLGDAEPAHDEPEPPKNRARLACSSAWPM
jgi:hypothetical protein